MNAIALALTVLLAQTAPQYGEEEKGNRQREAYRQGYKEGFDEGYRKGREEAEHRAAAAANSAAAAANAAAAAAVEAAKPKPTGPIRIISAVYTGGSGSCDAHRWLGPKVNGKRSASVEVSNSMCGDPAYGKRKSLEVAYTCGTMVKEASAYEHRTLYLDCNS